MASEPDAVSAAEAEDSFGDWEQVHFTTSTETPAATSAVPEVNSCEILPSPPQTTSDGDDVSGGERVRRRMEVLRSRMFGVVERVRRRCGGMSGGVWSCVVVVAAVLMYVKLVKWRRWVREETASRFAIIIKEKDEKIRRLMLEIVKLKQMLITGGNRVRVFRFYQSRNVVM